MAVRPSNLRIEQVVEVEAERVRHKVGRCRICRLRNVRLCGSNPGIAKDSINQRYVGLGDLDLTREEEERVILPQRSAKRKTALMVADQRLAAADCGDRRECGKEFVAVEVEDIAMDVVRADRMTMLALAPALRPWSASPPDCMENWSIASMGISRRRLRYRPGWKQRCQATDPRCRRRQAGS